MHYAVQVFCQETLPDKVRLLAFISATIVIFKRLKFSYQTENKPN